MARPGNVGFISQSGALCTAVLDWSLQRERRLQRLRLDRLDARRRLGRPDRLPRRRPAHPAASSSTWRSIGDARAFLSAAREVALTKPIIVIKAGRTAGGGQGGGLAHRLAHRQRRGARRGLPPLRRAARRHASPSCSTWPRCWPSSRGPTGPRLTIVTNAGGPGVLATDALIAGGGELAELSPRDDRRRSNAFLPAALEPQQPDRHPRRRRPRALRQGARDRRRTTRTATACW